MVMADEISVSTVGKRQRHQRAGGIPHRPRGGRQQQQQQQVVAKPPVDSIQQQITQLMERLERDSLFFEQNPPAAMPNFEASGK